MFCKVFDIEGEQLLVVKDPESKGLTFTTITGRHFRSASSTFETPEKTQAAWEEINQDIATHIHSNMMKTNNIHGDGKEDG